MSCPENELLSAFADGELDDTQTLYCERHLAGCASCLAFVEETQRLNVLGRSALRSIKVAAPLPQQPVVSKPTTTMFWRSPAFFAVAASFALLLTAWMVFQQLRIFEKPKESVEASEWTPNPNKESLSGLEQIREEDAPWTYDDVAFENWAAYYRQRRIPLVAMEKVPQYLAVPAANPSEQEKDTANVN